ncbi:MAG: DUF4162 domain-containing protein, partial [Bacteroidota bacterium]
TIGFIYAGKLVALGSPTELKEQMGAGTTYEVVCDRPLDAVDLFQRLSWVAETSIFGSHCHVTLAPMTDGPERIRRTLTEAGIALQRMEPITPSLEDVFIHLIAEEDKRRARTEAA